MVIVLLEIKIITVTTLYPLVTWESVEEEEESSRVA